MWACALEKKEKRYIGKGERLEVNKGPLRALNENCLDKRYRKIIRRIMNKKYLISTDKECTEILKAVVESSGGSLSTFLDHIIRNSVGSLNSFDFPDAEGLAAEAFKELAEKMIMAKLVSIYKNRHAA